MFKLVFTDSYRKREKVFIRKHPNLIPRYKSILKLLELNPAHPSLKLHKLKGKFADKYSVSITFNYRVVLTFVFVADEIILIDVGHHDEIY